MAPHPDRYCPVFGNYPKEYNRAVHGPYYPWVDYRPKDTPLKDVKLGEFKQWFARRDKTPVGIMAAFSRNYNWWYNRWICTRFGSPSKGYLQLIAFISISSLLGSYGYYRAERTHKYHW